MNIIEYYRVITPDTFSNLDCHDEKGLNVLNKSIEDAKLAIEQWGTVNKESEYFQYWEEQKRKCKIEHVVEISNLI